MDDKLRELLESAIQEIRDEIESNNAVKDELSSEIEALNNKLNELDDTVLHTKLDKIQEVLDYGL